MVAVGSLAVIGRGIIAFYMGSPGLPCSELEGVLSVPKDDAMGCMAASLNTRLVVSSFVLFAYFALFKKFLSGVKPHKT